MNREGHAVVRCPTCGARQEWSETCRRCKCDLGLLRLAEQAYRRTRLRCLRALEARRTSEALRQAHRCHWIRPGADSARLLALCTLLRGDWPAAVALAAGAPEED
jgi:hypothetical protein